MLLASPQQLSLCRFGRTGPRSQAVQGKFAIHKVPASPSVGRKQHHRSHFQPNQVAVGGARKLQSCRISAVRPLAAASSTSEGTVPTEKRGSGATSTSYHSSAKPLQVELVHGWSLSNLKADAFGGLTAAVIALPLALAFGVASGAGALAGLYGSIFVGFFAALFGGTPAQISGPTGPMCMVTAAIISQYKAHPGAAFSVCFLAGLVQIVMGLLQLGRYVRLVPLAVTSGFMTGIGCIIIMTQSLALLGHSPASNALEAVQRYGGALASPNLQAVLVGSVSLGLCMFTPRRISRVVPGSLLALVCGTLLSIFMGFDLPTLGHIPTGIPMPISLSFPTELLPAMMASAVILAVLGGIDSLLTSLVADSITGTYHQSNRELIGQGIGNAVSGLFGGVPGAGATMRTVVNVRAGGRTPISGAFHSVILLCVCLGLGRYASRVPLAVLAGILLKTGTDVLDFAYLRRLRQLPASSIMVMAVTLTLTVVYDLIAAVAAGVIMASLLYVKQMAEYQIESCQILTASSLQTNGSSSSTTGLSASESSVLKASFDHLVVFKLKGPFSFGAANGMIRKVLPVLEQFDVSVLDVTDVDILDDNAALAVEEMLDKAKALCRKMYVSGANEGVAAMFERLEIDDKLPLPSTTDRLVAMQAGLRRITSSSLTEDSIDASSSGDCMLDDDTLPDTLLSSMTIEQ